MVTKPPIDELTEIAGNKICALLRADEKSETTQSDAGERRDIDRCQNDIFRRGRIVRR